MSEIAQTLLIIGFLFLLGLATEALGRRTCLPRVTLLLLFGLLIGPSALNLIPEFTKEWFPLVVHRLPHIGEVVFPIVIGATILFEILGPVLTRGVLVRVGESRQLI